MARPLGGLPGLGSAGADRATAQRHERMRAIRQDWRVSYEPGDAVEYIAEPVFDLIIQLGDVGEVTRVADGWVYAIWSGSGEHSVPIGSVHRVD